MLLIPQWHRVSQPLDEAQGACGTTYWAGDPSASPQLVQSCWWMEPAPRWLRVDRVGKVGPFPFSYLLCVPLAPCRPHNQLFALPPHCRRVRGGHRGGKVLHFQLSSSSLMQGGGYESSISPALERGVMERKMGPAQMLKSQTQMARHHDSI